MLPCACRLVRFATHCYGAVCSNFDVTAATLPQQSLALTLFAYLVRMPFVQLLVSVNFMLNMRAAIKMQLLNLVAALLHAWNAPVALQPIPGMAALAGSLCSTLQVWNEAVLFVITLGASPWPGSVDVVCRGPLAFNQLIVFTHLLVSFTLPLYVAHVVEHWHKARFWQSHGMDLALARSVFMPLPERPVLSHVLVVLLLPTVLWLVAELLAPYAVAVAG